MPLKKKSVQVARGLASAITVTARGTYSKTCRHRSRSFPEPYGAILRPERAAHAACVSGAEPARRARGREKALHPNKLRRAQGESRVYFVRGILRKVVFFVKSVKFVAVFFSHGL